MKSEAREKAEAIAQEILGILDASATSTQWEQMVETIMDENIAYAYTYLHNENGRMINKSLKYWKDKTIGDILIDAFSHYKTNNFHIEECSRQDYNDAMNDYFESVK